MKRLFASVLSLLAAGISTAHAGCPQELAVYSAYNGDGLEFTGNSDAEFHQIRILLQGMPQLDGFIELNIDTGLPELMIQYDCPDGDLTLDDLAECTLYRSAVYAQNSDSKLGALTDAGKEASPELLLPNFAEKVWRNPAFKGAGPTQRPAEIYKLSGCLE